MLSDELKKIRTAVADYMSTEGCGCCRDVDGHKDNKATLATLLKVPKYKDGSDYNFHKFKSKL